MKTVSCIIPAYNESTRIGKVLDAVRDHPLISEVLVVDDGSVDGTAEIVEKEFPFVRLIVHKKNQGKSMALHTGITEAKGEYLLFLDADLVGLTPQNITDLIEPVISGRARWSMSMRENSPWPSQPLGMDYISGERVYHKNDLLPLLPQFPSLSNYGIETFLNLDSIEKGYSLKVVYWDNARFTWKAEKVGFLKGTMGDLKMTWDIIQIVPFYKIPWIVYRLRKLMVR